MAAAAAAVTGGGIVAALPEELLLEVFSRVGNVKALFQFAVTCRRWLRLFTDPAFLRELCCPGEAGHGSRGARLLGFLTQHHSKFVNMRMTMQHAPAAVPTFVPAPGSLLGPTNRALTSFVSGDDGAFDYAEPLAARRGVVLMELAPRGFDLQRATVATRGTRHFFGLCNLTTGERHVLPSLECSSSSNFCACLKGYAIVTGADAGEQPPSSSPPPGRFTSFSQVLLIRQVKCQLCVYSYSAAARSWGAPAICLDIGRFSLVGERSAVVHRGMAHWLCIDHECEASGRGHHSLYKLSVEVGTMRVSVKRLPVRVGGSQLLCVGRDGKLSIACAYMVHVTVWTQQDEDGGDDGAPAAWDGAPAAWLRTQVIRLPMPVLNPNDPQCRSEEWFEFNTGSILVLYRGGDVCVLDLEKEEMAKVMDCFPCLFSDIPGRRPSPRYVPYEVDLVEFFVSRLGCTKILAASDPWCDTAHDTDAWQSTPSGEGPSAVHVAVG